MHYYVNQYYRRYLRMVKLGLILGVFAYLEHNFTMTRLYYKSIFANNIIMSYIRYII